MFEAMMREVVKELINELPSNTPWESAVIQLALLFCNATDDPEVLRNIGSEGERLVQRMTDLVAETAEKKRVIESAREMLTYISESLEAVK